MELLLSKPGAWFATLVLIALLFKGMNGRLKSESRYMYKFFGVQQNPKDGIASFADPNVAVPKAQKVDYVAANSNADRDVIGLYKTFSSFVDKAIKPDSRQAQSEVIAKAKDCFAFVLDELKPKVTQINTQQQAVLPDLKEEKQGQLESNIHGPR